MKSFLLITLLCMLFHTQHESPSRSVKIKVTVNTFRNNNGYACFALFKESDDFPSFKGKTQKTIYVKITNNVAETEFEDIPAGDYAVGVYHDENNNKEFDTNFLGIPKEGVGCSNNPKGGFGPPDFDDARFKFSGNVQTISINVRYL